MSKIKELQQEVADLRERCLILGGRNGAITAALDAIAVLVGLKSGCWTPYQVVAGVRRLQVEASKPIYLEESDILRRANLVLAARELEAIGSSELAATVLEEARRIK